MDGWQDSEGACAYDEDEDEFTTPGLASDEGQAEGEAELIEETEELQQEEETAGEETEEQEELAEAEAEEAVEEQEGGEQAEEDADAAVAEEEAGEAEAEAAEEEAQPQEEEEQPQEEVEEAEEEQAQELEEEEGAQEEQEAQGEGEEEEAAAAEMEDDAGAAAEETGDAEAEEATLAEWGEEAAAVEELAAASADASGGGTDEVEAEEAVESLEEIRRLDSESMELTELQGLVDGDAVAEEAPEEAQDEEAFTVPPLSPEDDDEATPLPLTSPGVPPPTPEELEEAELAAIASEFQGTGSPINDSAVKSPLSDSILPAPLPQGFGGTVPKSSVSAAPPPLQPDVVPEADDAGSAPQTAATAGSGYVFCCGADAELECQSLQLLAAPATDLGAIKSGIRPDTQLFLFNTENLMLVGPFSAVNEPRLHVAPTTAFCGALPAQVQARPLEGTLWQALWLDDLLPGAKTAKEVAELRACLFEQGDAVDATTQAAWDCAPKLFGEVVDVDGLHAGEPPNKRPKLNGLTAASTPMPKFAAVKPDPLALDRRVSSTGSDSCPTEGGEGYVFACSAAVQIEAQELKMIGAQVGDMGQMRKFIGSHTEIFLVDVMSKTLTGPFAAVGQPSLNIMPPAFGGRLKAQVRLSLLEGILMRVALEDTKIPPGPKSADELASIRGLLDGQGLLVDVSEQEAWSEQGSDQPLAKRPKVATPTCFALPEPQSEADNQGRPYNLQMVVVNLHDVGTNFATTFLKPWGMCQRDFDWEGVRRCVDFLRFKLMLEVVGVVHENYRQPDRGVLSLLPQDIKQKCKSIQETPRIDNKNHSEAFVEMTIKCAYKRNCRFIIDNANYASWVENIRDQRSKAWIQHCQDSMQIPFYFDDQGTFTPL